MREALREELYQLHMELSKNELVKWTGGNISVRDPGSGFVLIKPSGLRYEQLRSEDMVLIAIGDEFGGSIPVGGFALIGGEDIGKIVVNEIGSSPAILLKNHGVFTIGPTVEKAVKAAVMTEDVAKTVWLAMQIDQPDEIARKMLKSCMTAT